MHSSAHNFGEQKEGLLASEAGNVQSSGVEDRLNTNRQSTDGNTSTVTAADRLMLHMKKASEARKAKEEE